MSVHIFVACQLTLYSVNPVKVGPGYNSVLGKNDVLHSLNASAIAEVTG